ncbi:MFS transporter [Streptomyces sp. NPDC059080]|uniref:MFS transporter n=1 Tax=Streptomyces sp. NPDC059080 TaxID=3346718 RepID=UPI0036ADB24D
MTVSKEPLGRRFNRLWAAYTVSAFGTRLAFNALPLTALLVLHAGPTQVAALSAAGAAVGAVAAVPLGPWVEGRRKRPVMIAMDLVRCAAMLSIPAAYALGLLGFAQLLVVSVVVGAADIAFSAASGAFLKSLLPPERLLRANGRLEATTWTTTMLGPPLGGAAVGALGPILTVTVDAVSYLLSALALRAVGSGAARPGGVPGPRTEGASGGGSGQQAADGPDPGGPKPGASGSGGPETSTGPETAKAPARPRTRAADLLTGWRFLLSDPALRPLFLNTVLVNGLIMATEPLLTVLLVDRLGFAPWQYGLAFALPCAGGLIGSRLARPLVARYGRRAVLLTTGTLRVCWLPWLALTGPGVGGFALVVAVELAMICCIGVYNPVLVTYRLDRIPADRVARVLAAWSVTSRAVIATLTALGGLLAAVAGTRTALLAAGLLALTTPLLLIGAGRAVRDAAPAPPPFPGPEVPAR